jgi:hypothetical protein
MNNRQKIVALRDELITKSKYHFEVATCWDNIHNVRREAGENYRAFKFAYEKLDAILSDWPEENAISENSSETIIDANRQR